MLWYVWEGNPTQRPSRGRCQSAPKNLKSRISKSKIGPPARYPFLLYLGRVPLLQSTAEKRYPSSSLSTGGPVSTPQPMNPLDLDTFYVLSGKCLEMNAAGEGILFGLRIWDAGRAGKAILA